MKKILVLLSVFALSIPAAVFAQEAERTVSNGCIVAIVQNLKTGSRDAMTSPKGQVTQLQLLLQSIYGLHSSTVTGFFGPVTSRNVKRFQKDAKLPETGMVASMTRAKIADICSLRAQQGAIPAVPVTALVPTTTAQAITVPAADPATSSVTSVVPVQPTYSKPKDVSEYISNAFSCILKRPATTGEFSFWKDNYVTKAVNYKDIFFGFFNGDEYKKLNTTNQDFVDQLYHCVYYREADAQSRVFWDQQVISQTRDEMVRQFVGSYEFESNILPLMKQFNGTY